MRARWGHARSCGESDLASRRGLEGARVLLVEDDPRMTRALCRVLGRHGMEVVVEDLCRTALARVQVTPFDAAVLDFVLSDGDGLDVARALGSARAPTASVVITGHPGAWNHVAAAIRAGVVRYLQKPCPTDELCSALELAIALTRAWRGSLARAMSGALDETPVGSVALASTAGEPHAAAARYHLSPRQSQVLPLLLDGRRNREIALILGLSARAVRDHVDKILKRLAVHSRHEIWRRLRAQGLD